MNYDKLVTLDIECYFNYVLFMFKKISDGKVIYFEKFNDSTINTNNLLHILKKYTIITFNGINYDSLIVGAVLSGFSNKAIHKISTMIIEKDMRPWEVRKQSYLTIIKFDHIDLIEVAPLKASLKIYGGRLHAPKLQDLPIEPNSIIVKRDLKKMRLYCENDLDLTILVFKQVEPEIKLRISMGKQYGLDLRSKSDAQIAEVVIKKEMNDKYYINPKRPKIKEGTEYSYNPPGNIIFQTPILKDVLRQYCNYPFTVGKSGHISFIFDNDKPKAQLIIGDTKYTIGIGGLHSCEKSINHKKGSGILREYDVAAYYPRIILNNKLYPEHIGEPFLDIYGDIVDRRLKAKHEHKSIGKNKDTNKSLKIKYDKYKAIDESLKITINGSFGKLGSKWSCLYSPDLMLQVTITGQLTLLMLIERLELNGIKVVSGNTDGIVVKMTNSQESLAKNIVNEWEFDTDYILEATDYTDLYMRDVNNYIAIKEDGIKGKGMYADQLEHLYKLRKNPVDTICIEAVKKFLKNKIDIEGTIRGCKDITKFLTLRTVNGGAIKYGGLLGKSIRWYYGANELDAIYYNTSGNKVPKSDGGVPMMDLPSTFPNDIDYDRYIRESVIILKNIGWG